MDSFKDSVLCSEPERHGLCRQRLPVTFKWHEYFAGLELNMEDP